MLRERFYTLVDAARDGEDSHTPSASPARLARALENLNDEDLLDFVSAFHNELTLLNRWDVWGAGYVASGGMSEDGFRYFRAWLVGKGCLAVDAVLQDADSLAELLDGSSLENEELEYVGEELAEERGLADRRNAMNGEDPDDPPKGEPFNEQDAGLSYPRTARSSR